MLIPQEINIVPDMTVAENIMLNHEPTRFGLIDRPALLARAREVLVESGLDLDSAQWVRSPSHPTAGGDRQSAVASRTTPDSR